MCGEAYLQSSRIAATLGSYSGYAANREPQLRVIDKHRAHAHRLNPVYVPLDLLGAAREAWDTALASAKTAGVRNSQVTVLAPTGTIAFMMDCDTTGVEPDIALVKYKKLVGGGLLKIVNNTVPRALRRLGYDSKEVQEIVEYIDDQETIEGAPALRPEHLAVFDCAFRPARGARSIHPLGHIRMMGAVQPFISGAISKTINVPETATVEDIEQAYIEGEVGLKRSRSTRRCKKTSTHTRTSAWSSGGTPAEQSHRRKMPAQPALCSKFDVGGPSYVHVGSTRTSRPSRSS